MCLHRGFFLVNISMVNFHSNKDSLLWFKLKGYQNLIKKKPNPIVNMKYNLIDNRRVSQTLYVTSFKVTYYDELYIESPDGIWTIDKEDYLFAIQPLYTIEDFDTQTLGIITEYLFTPDAEFLVSIGKGTTSILHSFTANLPEKLIEEIINYGNEMD